MLDRLTLENFQCHEDLEIELDPKLTSVVGDNGSGKSGALRSLQWLATNRPQGDAFVRHGAKGSEVKLGVDGRSIARLRGKTTNEYRLDDGGTLLPGAGGPPEPVEALLNLAAESFAGQHDALFWLSLPAPEVSRRLNAVVRLDLIDNALAYLGAEQRRAKATAEVANQRLTDAKGKRKALQWVPAMQEMFTKLVNMSNNALQASLAASSAADLVADGKKYKETVDNAAQANLAIANGVSKLAALRDKWQEAQRQATQADELCRRLRGAVEQVKLDNTEREQAERELAKASRGRCPICGKER
jgi:DNA repair exonuclease SbcCD ATPase subunit